MKKENPILPDGYSSVPPGKLATVVTCLQMFAPPKPRPSPETESRFALDHWASPSLEAYRAIFRAVGENWMWVSRLVMSDEALNAILRNPAVEIYVLRDGDRPIGLLELDFRQEGECELGYFGLVKDAIGKGAGRFLMSNAIAKAWSKPITRFWVHTCHFDSPAALPFYQRSGFTPYRFMVEIIDDPRLGGVLPRTASPHIPLIEPSAF
ncbi:GNAT family N-acetyltransferase [Rhizobium deserti]|uniref:GNAT family N-acetyltransferase n=2 Tax=Rhizobium deserti TaxID=2547961 RepID=A0A4R5UP48_9HYPH|nr:GNAT family N-acetyltransferase [Rhizobium deserti]